MLAYNAMNTLLVVALNSDGEGACGSLLYAPRCERQHRLKLCAASTLLPDFVVEILYKRLFVL